MRTLYLITLFLMAGCNLSPEALLGGKDTDDSDNWPSSSASVNQTPITACSKRLKMEASSHSDCDSKSYWSREYEDFIWGFTSTADNRVNILLRPSHTGKEGELVALGYVDLQGKGRALTCSKETNGSYNCLLPSQTGDIENMPFYFHSMYLRRGSCIASLTVKKYPYEECSLPTTPEAQEVVDPDDKKLPMLTPVKDSPTDALDELGDSVEAQNLEDEELYFNQAAAPSPSF